MFYWALPASTGIKVNLLIFIETVLETNILALKLEGEKIKPNSPDQIKF